MTTQTASHWRRNSAILVGLVAVVVLSVILPVGQWSKDLAVWIRGAGVSGVAIFVAAYLVFGLLMFPASVLTVGAGFAYGAFWGTALVMPSSMVAAALLLQLSRTVARQAVTHRLGQSPRFAAIDAAIADRGFHVVLLLRLSPIFPFHVLSYVLGLTQVRMHDYLVASFAGALPSTILYAYLGSAVTDLGAADDAAATGMAGQVMYWGGLAATLAATVMITRAARRPLEQALASSSKRDLAPRQ
jgi:uncharacterized membrane protein YdjX (TVP38/TMEM64 family)